MSDVEWTIDPKTIAVELEIKECETLLAHLILNSVVFINSSAGFVGPGAGPINVLVLCSDTFAYACADCEILAYDQIPVLYRLWQREPDYGAIAWCMAQRCEMPIKPCADRMRELGYDLDALMRGELP